MGDQLLVALGEVSIQEAAVVLGLSNSAVKMRIHRARKRLMGEAVAAFASHPFTGVGAGAALGSKEAVAKVGAVAQLETSFMDKMFRIKVLVPIEGKDATKLKRVPGVGVSAVIDIKL